ncbi:MAG: hypothetical protein Q9193_005344 [Seirophora villosa]
MDMCRFSGVQDPEYLKVIAALDRVKTRVSEKKADTESSGVPPELDKDRRQLILDSMWFRAIDARYATIKPAHARTCKWLLQKSQYQDWLDVKKVFDHHGLLWIKGKPGSGKSTLLKFAVQNVRKTMKQAVVICFFFNARGEDLEKTTLGMYRSLLWQVLHQFPDLQDILDHFTSVKDADTFDWQIEQLQSLFEAAIRRLEQRQVICFIDALDESDEDQIRDLLAFLERLGRPAASSPINIRVCLSSRHYPHISIGSGIEMTLEGQEGHNQDIANVLSSELKAGKGRQFEAIKEEIQSRASGVFLWVVLVVQILNKEYDHGRVHALRRRLGEIPDGLDKLFEDILTRDNARFEELILCLQWILYAKRPLKREELYFAILSGTDNEALAPWDPEMVTAPDMDKFILSCSKGLAETTKSKSQTVQFIHESVRDFLLGKNGINKLRSELDFGQSHERLRQSCYLYMKIDVSEDLPRGMELPKAKTLEDKELRARISEKFPFLEYAVQNVLLHADDAGRHGIPQKSFLQDLDKSQWILLDNLFEKHQVRRRTHVRTSELLFVFIHKNLSSLALTYVRCWPRVFFDSHLEIVTATLAHSKVGEDLVRDLLLPAWQPSETYKKAAELVIDLWPSFFASKIPTFLAWAASLGHDTVLRSLLTIDAIPVRSLNRKDAQGRMLLSLAAINGHQAVVELLLAKSADPNIRDKDGRTPLMVAAMNGHNNVVQLLLTKTADLDIRGTDDRTSLMLAAMNGHDNVVRLLLEKHDPSKRNHPSVIVDMDGRTPLMVAATKGHEAVVQLLLADDQVDVNCQDFDGFTSLSRAAAAGDEAVVKLLLAKETVCANHADRSSRTPLFYAARNGHEAVVRLLLNDERVQAFYADKHGRTPLFGAAMYGSEPVALLLLEMPNVDPNHKDERGDSSLVWAIREVHLKVVNALLATQRVNLDGVVENYRDVLQEAARRGDLGQAALDALRQQGFTW